MEHHVCRVCGESKPEPEYYFDGWYRRGKCKACEAAYRAAYRALKKAQRPPKPARRRAAQTARWSAECSAPSTLNMREHWASRARRTKTQREATLAGWREAGSPTVPVPGVIELCRVGRRKLDTDNLAGALKAIRDEVARIAGIDDGDDRIEWRYEQETSARTKPHVVIHCWRESK